MFIKVSKVVDAINNNFNKEIRITDLAYSVNLSRTRLFKLFKEELGISPKQYLRILRIKKGKELLEKSRKSIKEIAHQVGYNDGTHFMRDFKRIYKLSPSQYRNKYVLSKDLKFPSANADRPLSRGFIDERNK
jgi:transcriptional regulator GlxA family with amidase domain